MRRFDFNLDDALYDEFYRTFPEYGRRSDILRKFIRRLLNEVKVQPIHNPDYIIEFLFNKGDRNVHA